MATPVDSMTFPKVANFKQKEFACKCGCGAAAMHPSFILRLQEAREISIYPYSITSGFRCRQHNLDEGAKETSSHTRGCASDIAAKESYKRFRIVSGLLLAGFKRIGIGKDFIHVDEDPEKPEEMLWLYPLNRKKRS